MIGKGKNAIVADIGAGSGYVTIYLASKVKKVYAFDLTPSYVKLIQKKAKNLNLNNVVAQVSTAESLPLKDNSVDFIVANAILEHIEKEEKTINEWKRVLKPKGKIFITVPLKYRYLWPFFWPINYVHDKKIGHLRRYDKSDLAQKFDMKLAKFYYTGHLFKVLGVILNIFLKSQKLAELLEKIDNRFTKKRFGASNISVVLEKFR